MTNYGADPWDPATEWVEGYWPALVRVNQTGAAHNATYTNNQPYNYINATYLRLKTLQFGWHLPEKWVKKIKMSDISIYFSGENLYTWSPVYKWTRDLDIVTALNGSDSDISSDNVGDGHNYPSMRTFSFGLTLKF